MSQLTDWAAAGRRKGPARRWLFGVLVAVGAIVFLVTSSLRGATVYSWTVTELRAKGEQAVGQEARVSGKLDGNSVQWDAANLRLAFQIADNGQILAVAYEGVKPDMFNDGAEVIVEGKLQPDDTFAATKLMLKCPSKYEAGTPVYEPTPTRGR
jgi:cytochrome c-type biogenesis protein CcmE